MCIHWATLSNRVVFSPKIVPLDAEGLEAQLQDSAGLQTLQDSSDSLVITNVL